MKTNTTTQRIEAFSDGVMAIIFTIMIFDIKLSSVDNTAALMHEFHNLLPKILSYSFSFITLSILWVNHHQLFQQLHQGDRVLLWLNIHLLFWMSFIPFTTHVIGNNPNIWFAAFLYGMVFFFSALSFTLIRVYVLKTFLVHEEHRKISKQKISKKNILALLLYLSGALLSYFSLTASYIFFVIVPVLYFIPEHVQLQKNTHQ